jgi:hypothetical protein
MDYHWHHCRRFCPAVRVHLAQRAQQAIKRNAAGSLSSGILHEKEKRKRGRKMICSYV